MDVDRVVNKFFRKAGTGAMGKLFGLIVLSLFLCSCGSGGGSSQSGPPPVQVIQSNNPSAGFIYMANYGLNLTPSSSTYIPFGAWKALIFERIYLCGYQRILLSLDDSNIHLCGKSANHITSFLEREKKSEFSNLAKTEGTRGHEKDSLRRR